MKHINRLDLRLVTLAVALLGTSGCRMVGGIFRAGAWVGILGLLLLLAVVLGIARMVSHPH